MLGDLPEHKDEWFGMKKIPYTLTISTLIIEEISTLETSYVKKQKVEPRYSTQHRVIKKIVTFSG